MGGPYGLSFAANPRDELRPRYAEYFDNQNADYKPTEVVRRLFIDNRDRDATNDAVKGDSAPFDFVVPFQALGIDRYQNVVACELLALSFPKVLNETYVIVDIAEFADQIDSSDNGSDRTFAVAFFDCFDPQAPVGTVKPIKGKDFTTKRVDFEPRLPSLSRLTCRFRKYGGDIVTLGDVGNVGTVNMLLEVTTLIGDRS